DPGGPPPGPARPVPGGGAASPRPRGPARPPAASMLAARPPPPRYCRWLPPPPPHSSPAPPSSALVLPRRPPDVQGSRPAAHVPGSHPGQAERVLPGHCAHARVIWSLAVEQHSHWRQGRRTAHAYLDQGRQLAAVRAEYPRLAATRHLRRPDHRGKPVVSFAGWVSGPPMGHPLTAPLIASANRR